MARVNLEVPEAKKSKWEEHAEESPEAGGNLSALIRLAVEKEIAGGEMDRGESEKTLMMLGEMSDSLREVLDRLDHVESRLTLIEKQSAEEPEVGELKGDVFDLLPDVEPGSREWQDKAENLHQQAQAEDDDEIQAQAHGWQGTIDRLSLALDEPQYIVGKAIEKLMTDTHLVRSVEWGDETRYYKEV